MYINDILRRVNKLYPSEYDDMDMYIWCDEVSAMLAVEDRQVFRELIMPYKDKILLPEGVRFENVTKVFAISGGREAELTKRDFRTIPYDRRELLEVLPACDRIRIVYAQPFVPIRIIIYDGAIVLDDHNNTIRIKDNEFLRGDTLVMKLGDDYIENIHVFDTYADSSDLRYSFIKVNDGALDNADTSATEGKIQRIITDKTYCDPPFDTMYIDYVLAMIHKYQHDTSGYNQYISSFNSRLAAYRRWLVDKLPYDDGQFINFWKGV